jgi:molecular chaperone DnaK
LIDARNKADQMVWQMEKLLKEHGDKLSEGDKAPIQSAIDKVKDAAKADDPSAIERAIGELEQASHAMAQHLYSRGQGGPGGAGGGTGGGPGGGGPSAGPSGDGHGQGKDDVIDAEFEVKK